MDINDATLGYRFSRLRASTLLFGNERHALHQFIEFHTDMKAISIKQPWANMIASGEKTIETRTWSTSYRGHLLIVSSKKPDIEPAGYALAIATIVDCKTMSVLDEPAACCRIYPGAFAWVLRDIRQIPPFPVTGRMGLFDVALPAGVSET